jgi:3-methyladenine DNA glycosylase Tag
MIESTLKINSFRPLDLFMCNFSQMNIDRPIRLAHNPAARMAMAHSPKLLIPEHESEHLASFLCSHGWWNCGECLFRIFMQNEEPVNWWASLGELRTTRGGPIALF